MDRQALKSRSLVCPRLTRESTDIAGGTSRPVLPFPNNTMKQPEQTKAEPSVVKAVATAIIHKGEVIQICADSYPIIKGFVGRRDHYPPHTVAIIMGPSIKTDPPVPSVLTRLRTFIHRTLTVLKP